ncbi:hypothetical protein [Chitinimonas sp. JJ19]|uniref:hypothetical protein n=1 Tax=Chitinimonas sp. JJ19 TaxID=3109352 RepID=UPI003001E13F
MKKLDLLTTSAYEKNFKGYSLVDCAARHRGIFNFVLKQEYDTNKGAPADHELKTRVVILFMDEPDDYFDHSQLTGWSSMLAGASNLPKNQFVGASGMGHIYVIGSGDVFMENQIPNNGGKGPFRAGLRRLKQFNGWLYGCDGLRTVFKREGNNQWVNVGGYPKEPKEREWMENRAGFEDLDFFSETDLYAVGGQGDVWHCDGSRWRQIAFPSNMYLHSVCCGGDGQVYIGAQSGNVFRGRGDKWEHLHKDDLTLPFKDMVWFNDRVYATSDYGLWEIQDGKVRPSEAPIEITNCAGNLWVADGVMLLAGQYGAALHDGKEWSRLFSLADLSTR